MTNPESSSIPNASSKPQALKKPDKLGLTAHLTRFTLSFLGCTVVNSVELDILRDLERCWGCRRTDSSLLYLTEPLARMRTFPVPWTLFTPIISSKAKTLERPTEKKLHVPEEVRARRGRKKITRSGGTVERKWERLHSGMHARTDASPCFKTAKALPSPASRPLVFGFRAAVPLEATLQRLGVWEWERETVREGEGSKRRREGGKKKGEGRSSFLPFLIKPMLKRDSVLVWTVTAQHSRGTASSLLMRTLRDLSQQSGQALRGDRVVHGRPLRTLTKSTLLIVASHKNKTKNQEKLTTILKSRFSFSFLKLV